ncbi:MAG: hypothetical protein JW932_03605 [Deltaproteobacteria bacterium]|nr:hypothetical protein [Deltaproteobacteria bacterium]
MRKEKSHKEITISGFITPEQWDDDDNVIAIGISTDDEDYVIELNKLGEELFDFIDEDVEVTGFIREDKDGTKHITISNYEILDTDDYEEEDEYYYGDEDDPYTEDDDEDDDEEYY